MSIQNQQVVSANACGGISKKKIMVLQINRRISKIIKSKKKALKTLRKKKWKEIWVSIIKWQMQLILNWDLILHAKITVY